MADANTIGNFIKRCKFLLVPVTSVLFAFLTGGIIIALFGFDPLEAGLNLLMGSFGSLNAIGESLVKTTPLIFTGLAYALAARCGMVNIGAEGQLYMGGFLSTLTGVYLTNLPGAIHLPLAVLAGFIGGGLWGLLAGWLKVKFGASEVITTIMLNYIAQYWVGFLVSGPMKEPPGAFPQTMPIAGTAVLPRLIPGTRLHLGIVLALFCVYIFYFFLWKTTTGYETRVVGMNQDAALYAGMNPSKNILLGMFLAGAFAGLAGTCEILGIQRRMIANFSPGYGFDGIAVALLGQNTPVGIILAAFLFGMIRAGANLMQMVSKVPVSVVYIIQALVILFVIGSSVIVILQRKGAVRKAAREDSGEGR
ncbi:MAG: ABC transporter permease [Treponema sp.]|jgi:simple sugar transport system permease protein|nr:ABC transporter permease [Treponema sp.]